LDYQPLVYYQTHGEYRAHFERIYCQGPITTFDGIAVRFRKSSFGHCFYESTKRTHEKDKFSVVRAERIDWIRTALLDPDAELYIGWDGKNKRFSRSRRVTLVAGNYLVVIRLNGPKTAQFVTAYVADSPSTLEKIKRTPKWGPAI
jgi:hypothetical protein